MQLNNTTEDLSYLRDIDLLKYKELQKDVLAKYLSSFCRIPSKNKSNTEFTISLISDEYYSLLLKNSQEFLLLYQDKDRRRIRGRQERFLPYWRRCVGGIDLSSDEYSKERLEVEMEHLLFSMCHQVTKEIKKETYLKIVIPERGVFLVDIDRKYVVGEIDVSISEVDFLVE